MHPVLVLIYKLISSHTDLFRASIHDFHKIAEFPQTHMSYELSHFWQNVIIFREGIVPKAVCLETWRRTFVRKFYGAELSKSGFIAIQRLFETGSFGSWHPVVPGALMMSDVFFVCFECFFKRSRNPGAASRGAVRLRCLALDAGGGACVGALVLRGAAGPII